MFVRGNISMTDKLQKLENAVKFKKKTLTVIIVLLNILLKGTFFLIAQI